MDKKQIQTLSGIEITVPTEKRLYINGNFVETEETFSTNSLSTGDRLADVSIATDRHVGEAVNAAARACEVWSVLPPLERRHHLGAFADELEAHGRALTRLDVADNGTSFERLRTNMSTAADLVKYFSRLIPELKGQTIPTGEGKIDFAKREPHGVIEEIIPFILRGSLQRSMDTFVKTNPAAPLRLSD